jgi:hypothetical protein
VGAKTRSNERPADASEGASLLDAPSLPKEATGPASTPPAGGAAARRLEGDLEIPGADELSLAGVLVARRRLAVHVADAGVGGGVEKLDSIGDDADGMTALALVGFPLSPLEPAIDADAAALARVAPDRVRRRSVDVDVEVVRALGQGPVRVSAAAVAGDPQPADARARRQRANLGVALRESASWAVSSDVKKAEISL